MDKSAYSNYSLALATLRLVRRVKTENPELWEKIQKEAALSEQNSKKESL